MSKSDLLYSSYLLILLLCLLNGPACSQTTKQPAQHQRVETNLEELTNKIDSLKAVFVPDSRVAQFDISMIQKQGALMIIGETTVPAAYESLLTMLEDRPIVDSVRVLPVGDFKIRPYGLISISAANIRAEARHSSELSTQAILGTPIKVYKQNGGWYYVQTPDGYLGWLNEGTFVSMTLQDLKEYQSKPKCVYTNDMGVVYQSANVNSQTLGDLTLGDILIFQGTEGSYTKIKLPDGQIGYILSDHIINWEEYARSFQPSRTELVATARSLLGRPYLWGGTSSKAMDCSGFTKTVFFAHHMILPRDASQQVHTGDVITTDINELNQVRPGDLLFFGRIQNNREKVTHVGIYLGEDRMIHAGDGKVQIQSLNPAHPDYVAKRRNSFLRAKNMLDRAGNNGVVSVSDSEWY